MTDLEKLRSLFTELGIGFKEKVDRCGGIAIVLANDGINPLIKGYGEFITEFYFDMHEKFVDVGLWE